MTKRAQAGDHVKPVLRLPRLLLRIMTIVLMALFMAGWAADHHALLDLFSHFQLQYFLCGLAAVTGLLIVGSRRWAVVAALLTLAAGASLAPWYWPRAVPNVEGRQGLRVMQFNVLEPNPQHQEVIAEVRRHDPDLVVFQEVDRNWASSLEALRDALPFSHFQPAGTLRGNLVMSRYELRDVVTEPSVCDTNSPSLSMKVLVHDNEVSLLVAHTTPPHNTFFAAMRNEELARLAKRATDLPKPLLFIGDINTTMWSPHYRRFERDSGLVNARRGFGVVPTFPMDGYRLLRVPLDHVLVSPDFSVAGCRRGRACGSDHAPLIVDLAL